MLKHSARFRLLFNLPTCVYSAVEQAALRFVGRSLASIFA